MAIDVVTFAGNAASGTGSSRSVPDDDALEEGDLRIFFFSISNQTITTPDEVDAINPGGDIVATSRRIYWFSRVHEGAEEPATIDFEFSAGANHSMVQFAVRGYDQGDPIDVSVSTGSASSGGTLTAPSRTTETDGALLVGGFAKMSVSTGTSLSLPGGMSNVANGSGNGSNGHAYRVATEIRATAGASGTRVSTTGDTTSPWGASAFAIKPAGAQVETGTGTAALDLDTAGTGRKVAHGTGTAALDLDASGTGDGTVQLTGTVVDNFDDGTINSSLWDNWGGAATTESGGTLRFALSSSVYAGIEGLATIDVADRFVGARLVDAGNQALASLEAYPIHLAIDVDNEAFWFVGGGFAVVRQRVATTLTSPVDFPYDPDLHRYFAIGETDGELWWLWSEDGADWHVAHRTAYPFGTTLLVPQLLAGIWDTEASSSTVQMDDYGWWAFTAPLLWVGDAETGDFSQLANPTGGIDQLSPQTRDIVEDPVRAGDHAFEFTINGVASENGSTRSEGRPAAGASNVGHGQERWYAGSIYLPVGFPINPGSWQVVTQWKEEPAEGTPPLALHVEGGRFQLQGGFGHPVESAPMPPQDLGPAVPGEWADFVVHILFDDDPEVGEISIWRDAALVLDAYQPPGGTAYPGTTSYLKIGVYRDPGLWDDGDPVTVYHDEWRIGTTREAVDVLPRTATGAGEAALDLAATGGGGKVTAGAGGAAAELAAGGTGAKVTTGVGATLLDVDASGTGRKVAHGTGTAALDLDTTGSGTSGQVETGTGTALLDLDAVGTGTKSTSGASDAALVLDATGTGAAVRRGSGASTLDLTAAASDGRKVAHGTGTAALDLDASSSAGPATRSGTGTARVDLDAGGGGAKASTGAGAAALDLAAAGTGTKATAGSGAVALDVDASGTGRGVRVGAGGIALTVDVDGAGAPIRRGGGTAALDLDTSSTAGPVTRRGGGEAAVDLAAAGSGPKLAAGAGAAPLALDAPGTGQKVAAGSGAVALDVDASGTGQKATAGVGSAALDLAVAGGGRKDARGVGSAALDLDTEGTGRGVRSGTATAALDLTLDAEGRRVGVGAGAAALTLDGASATGTRVGRGAGEAALDLDAAGAGGPRTARGTGTADFDLAALVEGRRIAVGRGEAALVLSAQRKRRVPGRHVATARTSRLVPTAAP